VSTRQQTIGQTVYRFEDLKTLLARASPARSGDELAGCAAQTPEERVAAQMALADLPLRHFCPKPSSLTRMMR
jgi:ethanolamine ammonia-lyase large subunit